MPFISLLLYLLYFSQVSVIDFLKIIRNKKENNFLLYIVLQFMYANKMLLQYTVILCFCIFSFLFCIAIPVFVVLAKYNISNKTETGPWITMHIKTSKYL